jgi:hypothetical protein
MTHIPDKTASHSPNDFCDGKILPYFLGPHIKHREEDFSARHTTTITGYMHSTQQPEINILSGMPKQL